MFEEIYGEIMHANYEFSKEIYGRVPEGILRDISGGIAGRILFKIHERFFWTVFFYLGGKNSNAFRSTTKCYIHCNYYSMFVKAQKD